jgi:hypothetical protein
MKTTFSKFICLAAIAAAFIALTSQADATRTRPGSGTVTPPPGSGVISTN